MTTLTPLAVQVARAKGGVFYLIPADRQSGVHDLGNGYAAWIPAIRAILESPSRDGWKPIRGCGGWGPEAAARPDSFRPSNHAAEGAAPTQWNAAPARESWLPADPCPGRGRAGPPTA